MTEETKEIAGEKLRFVDLFCGIGSFHYSFKELGWECVMACDINEHVRETYYKNYGLKPLGDIKSIDPVKIPEYDILCAGFPCQPFSQCGKHKGFNDDRGNLFFDILRLVDTNRPKIICLENVKGLLSHNKGDTFKRIKDEITSRGYKIASKVLTCSDYGLPQMRKRLFIIAVLNTENLSKNIDNILNLSSYETSVSLTDFFNRNFEKNTAYTIRCGGRRSKIDDKHNWDGYMVDGNEYRLTKSDCLQLQGFPSDFNLCGSEIQQWKQLGNTIPTIFTKIIGLSILKHSSKEFE